MTMQQQQTKVTPSGWWYLLPIGLWAAGLALFVWAVVSLFGVLESPDPVANHSRITVPGDGVTVYATDSGAGGSCTFTDSSGGSVPLDGFSADLEINGYHGLGSTPDGLDAGTYRLDCPGLPRGVGLAVGDRVDLGSLAVIALVGIVLPLIMGLAGLVTLIVLAVRRSNSKSRIRAARASGGYGAPAPGTPGGYGSPPGYGSPSGYGTPSGYGPPSGYGAPEGHGPPADHGQSAPPPPPPPYRWGEQPPQEGDQPPPPPPPPSDR